MLAGYPRHKSSSPNMAARVANCTEVCKMDHHAMPRKVDCMGNRTRLLQIATAQWSARTGKAKIAKKRNSDCMQRYGTILQ